MAYLAYLIALVMVVFGEDTSDMTFNEGMVIFLQNAEMLNKAFIWVAAVLWGALVVLILMAYLQQRKVQISIHFTVWSCFTAPLLVLPLSQFLMWKLNVYMLNSYSTEGITDPVKFWASAALTVLFGIS